MIFKFKNFSCHIFFVQYICQPPYKSQFKKMVNCSVHLLSGLERTALHLILFSLLHALNFGYEDSIDSDAATDTSTIKIVLIVIAAADISSPPLCCDVRKPVSSPSGLAKPWRFSGIYLVKKMQLS